MLLPKYGKVKLSRTHTGKVMTLKSNLRWCSDGFSILCDNGDQVYVAFSLDTCDRTLTSLLFVLIYIVFYRMLVLTICI